MNNYTIKDITRASGGFAMLAVDQREAMRLMFAAAGAKPPVADSVLTDFKVNAAKILSPYASAVLLDQQFCYRQAVEQNAVAKSCAMNGALRDKKYGGWYACVNDQGVVDASKQGYQHFFALLGAASAVTTGHPEARKLLDYAIEVIEKYFWSEEEQMCLESWDEAFSKTEDYRGGNANMHAVEAFLIVYDVTHDRKWLDRALRIASVIIHDVARSGDYRVNEHFDSQWNPIRDYNKDNPAHRFRAYGGTPGHWIEWGRLMLHLHAALEARSETPPAWLLEDAKGLFHATIRDAWAPDGADGFVYSVDWDGKPIVRERVRWPIVEAMGTAYALYTLTGDSQYEEWYQKWWDYCIKYLMDYENGSWWQELDADNKVTTKVWDGKQDIYHLLHCLVIPRLPLAPGLAPAVAAGLLDINAK